jgi:hypothetical protein
VSADDRVASVSRAAVRAHERAALIHSEAADLYARLVRPEKAATERRLAELERLRAEQAVWRHPELV